MWATFVRNTVTKQSSSSLDIRIEYKPSKTIRFRVNVQALIQLKVNDMVFPQPSIDNFNESYNNSHYKENVSFKNGQKVGFWENLLNYTNENPINYYWLDSRREECLIKE